MENKSILNFARKIAFLVIVAIGLFAVGVFASKSDMNYVTINFADDRSALLVLTFSIKFIKLYNPLKLTFSYCFAFSNKLFRLACLNTPLGIKLT